MMDSSRGMATALPAKGRSATLFPVGRWVTCLLRLEIALVALLGLSTVGTVHAQSFSFAGFTFDQTDTPDQGFSLSPGTYGGAIVTASPSSAAAAAAFPSSTVGFDSSRSVARIVGIASSGTRALNLPNGNNGTTARSGFQLSWSGGRKLPNLPGVDFVIYEAGSNSTSPEPVIIQVHNVASGTWSEWRYQPAQSFELYGGAPSEGAFATSYDLSDFGLADNDDTDEIRFVNLTDEDRTVNPSGVGAIIPEDNGSTSSYLPAPGPLASYTQFGSTTLDPDPLYVAAFHTPSAAHCGNGAVEAVAGEQCDPGGDVPNDCCDATCHFVNDATPCDDGAFCTVSDACLAGTCTGPARDCADTNACTVDSCDETTDTCVNDAAAANGIPCDDALFCTVADQCLAGTCGGSLNPCSDGNVSTQDSCDESGTQCLHAAAPADGSACDDADPCTPTSSCSGGSCIGGVALELCGDSLVCGAEQCDDGATADGDGCSSTCRLEIVQDAHQKACLKQVNSAASKVLDAQTRATRTCLGDASRGRIGDPQTCLVSDPLGRIDRVRRNTESARTRFCDAPPDFGNVPVATINDAAVDESIALSADLFGDLSAATIGRSQDLHAAKCQSLVAAAVESLIAAKHREFLRCKFNGLLNDTIVSETALTKCLDTVLVDGRGKAFLARRRLNAVLANICNGVDLDAAFPSLCVGAADLGDCFETHVNCRLCRALNRIDGLSKDCDAFDDGQTNTSCSN